MEKFKPVSETKITKAIVKDFSDRFLRDLESTDVVIVGGGPSGLIAAAELSKNKISTLVIESNNYLGGGFWLGGFLMNGLTVREPANTILDEIGVPYKKVEEGLYLASGPHACSKLIAYACDCGAQILNMAKFDDAVLKNNRVNGVVINWTPVYSLPKAITCVDPIAIESKLVIDATGHDAVVCNSLSKRNLLEISGFGAMWVEKSEDLVVEHTSEVYPGLIVCGMAVSTVFGIPRMGPTFGGMLLSGKKAATTAKAILEKSTPDVERFVLGIKQAAI